MNQETLIKGLLDIFGSEKLNQEEIQSINRPLEIMRLKQQQKFLQL